MTSIEEQYELLLASIRAITQQAEEFINMLNDQGAEFQQFENLFIGEHMIEHVKQYTIDAKKAEKALLQSISPQFNKYKLFEDFKEIYQQRSLLRSSSIRLIALLEKAGAQSSSSIVNQLCDGSLSFTVSAYMEKVKKLSSAVSAGCATEFQNTFKLPTRSQTASLKKPEQCSNTKPMTNPAKKKNKTRTANQIVCYPACQRESKLANKQLIIKAGDTIQFGTYPQTAQGNDQTPIDWIVLSVENGTALILSKEGITARAYDLTTGPTTWGNCALRKWLNNVFYLSAFSSTQRKAIKQVLIWNTQKDNEWHTPAGNATSDYVFLLSYSEVSRYLHNSYNRQCAPTKYAIRIGAETDSSHMKTGVGCGWWWLRSPGHSQNVIAAVSPSGGVIGATTTPKGLPTSINIVRPALWLYTDAITSINQDGKVKY